MSGPDLGCVLNHTLVRILVHSLGLDAMSCTAYLVP